MDYMIVILHSKQYKLPLINSAQRAGGRCRWLGILFLFVVSALLFGGCAEALVGCEGGNVVFLFSSAKDFTCPYICTNGTAVSGRTTTPNTERCTACDSGFVLRSNASCTTNDLNTLDVVGNNNPQGIWSDGTTMWVADNTDDKIYAYNLSTKARDSTKDFNTLDVAGNDDPDGIWSNGTNMWVVDYIDDKLYAYNLATKARD